MIGHSSGVIALAATEYQGQALAVSGGSDHRIVVWDIATGTLVSSIDAPSAVYAVAACDIGDQRVIVAGGEDGFIRDGTWTQARCTARGSRVTRWP